MFPNRRMAKHDQRLNNFAKRLLMTMIKELESKAYLEVDKRLIDARLATFPDLPQRPLPCYEQKGDVQSLSKPEEPY